VLPWQLESKPSTANVTVLRRRNQRTDKHDHHATFSAIAKKETRESSFLVDRRCLPKAAAPNKAAEMDNIPGKQGQQTKDDDAKQMRRERRD
jgi:hypothetical protein